ncbi:MAG TPA: hypothetical protein VFC93_21235 [Chloroflexota bacterium]|nr:hypothetical protein [Chloroflexota bacterium]
MDVGPAHRDLQDLVQPETDKTANDRAVVALAARLDAQLTERVLQAQASATQRRPDNQHLFESALAFPEAVANDLDQPLLVVADEFQHVVDLAVYPPFDAGRKLPAEDARNRLLAVVRAHIEAARRVGWVVTGSSVRLLQDILNAGPLMGRTGRVGSSPTTASSRPRGTSHPRVACTRRRCRTCRRSAPPSPRGAERQTSSGIDVVMTRRAEREDVAATTRYSDTTEDDVHAVLRHTRGAATSWTRQDSRQQR